MSDDHSRGEKGSLDQEHHEVDFANNVNAKIHNPLHGIPKAKLMSQVEEFTRERGFDDLLPVFQKGALIAQNPGKLRRSQSWTRPTRMSYDVK
ncbi:hypothetical protein PM082_010452 [Marasmius tenuissimus]|nr:hypothetical protein PM082_010452 [Marasmius tenuissimus]